MLFDTRGLASRKERLKAHFLNYTLWLIPVFADGLADDTGQEYQMLCAFFVALAAVLVVIAPYLAAYNIPQVLWWHAALFSIIMYFVLGSLWLFVARNWW